MKILTDNQFQYTSSPIVMRVGFIKGQEYNQNIKD